MQNYNAVIMKIEIENLKMLWSVNKYYKVEKVELERVTLGDSVLRINSDFRHLFTTFFSAGLDYRILLFT